MVPSIEQRVCRVLEEVESEVDSATLERVGRCVAEFVEGERRGESLVHPEGVMMDLPVQDHEVARRCFEMIELLRDGGGVESVPDVRKVGK